MGFLHDLRDPESDRSLSKMMREKRFAFFRSLVDPLPKPIRILDVGGTQDFWEAMDFVSPDIASITVVNLKAPESRHANITTMDANACDMPMFADGGFDVVFSNSVIEHVGELENQEAMAREVQRVGKRYFVQTPNLHFPIEPHYMFPFFQFMPVGVKTWLLMNFGIAWGGKIKDRDAAVATANSVKLLSGQRFTAMFPDAEIYKEKVLGLTKSFTAFGGW
jgi:2-polyprenyl-3-methyl-5-hydroxy-6-metoxy-1,4-benzoquinol methylase